MTPSSSALSAFGLAGALGLTRVRANLVFEVHARDPITFAAVGTTFSLAYLRRPSHSRVG